MTWSPAPERVKLWDPLVRGFHWLLASLVIVAWLLGKFGPSVMTLHFWCGYAVIALLVVRLVWGFVGPRSVRFQDFLYSPKAIAAYAKHLFRRQPSYWPGHNPLGGLSVFAMLAALLWQVGTGLISDPEDYINVGPLANDVGSELAVKAVGWHHTGSTLILILVALHVAMILFYAFWKRENLIKPMIDGWKLVIRRGKVGSN